MEEWHLTKGWEFKQSDKTEWMSVDRVPTNVHLDLIDNDIIEDPSLGYNELQCQWVSEKSWTYRKNLDPIPASSCRRSMKTVLAFDGLDTYATVRLNGESILRSDNMFIMHRTDVTDELSPDGDNILEIEFKSALLESRRIKDAHPEHKWVGWNGDMARLAARKAQYHFGWDWGPVLTTCGPWRPVRLEIYEARIDDLRIDYEVDLDSNSVRGTIIAAVEGTIGDTVDFVVILASQRVFNATAMVGDDRLAQVEFHINEPKLWYPRKYGEQTRYTVMATLKDQGRDLHSVLKRTGFRKAELIQDRDGFGRSFYFRINGTDVFCGGSNWIPADTFTPRLTKRKYRKWLQILIDGNQTMVRIWGGGIWEADKFYSICDEAGILVWQDFMFACGNYPAHSEFLKSVEDECICQMKRLRHHPSVVVYAGNNEDYQIQEQMGLTYEYGDKDSQRWLKTDFPARYIYEKLLPDIVATYSPHTVYHPGSPWGQGKATTDPTIGDLHEWNVWHGTQEKYQMYEKLGGRFNSEFGMQAFPHIETIKHFVTDPSQVFPQSQMIEFHNKAAGHERRIATYLMENFRMETDLRKFIHLTQICQAEALMFAFRGWRRQWGQERRCGGALVWQLNDCWPVISWSIVDYFHRKKPAYYAVRRALAPVAVAVRRSHHDWSGGEHQLSETTQYECWVVSSLTSLITATVELRYISIATGKEIKEASLSENVSIIANGTTSVLSGRINNNTEEPHVIAARLWVNDDLVSRDVDWPQPFKYVDFSDRGLQVGFSNGQIAVKAARPTKGLVLEERDGVDLSDNCLDVVPGDKQLIAISGLNLKDRELRWTFLGAP